jgi:predicted nuclease of predicted toxin-antitoxin system
VLRLLLDEQMSPEIAGQMQATYPEIPIASLHTWEEGRYRRSDDAAILMEAYRQGFTLVTYDTKTIVPLLKMWGEQGVTHGGVIFVKASAIAPHNIGGLMRALVKLWTEYGDQEWTNASIYLSP